MSDDVEAASRDDRPGRLIELAVGDLALIDRLRLRLEPGLNVLTGETGAGKSLVIDALGLALGARADTSLVRHGAETARVEAVFERLPEPLIAVREVSVAGRSTARLDDATVTSGRLAETVGQLVEIHGQHEQSRLLDERHQLDLLDAFGDHGELRHEVAAAVEGWRENRAAMEGLVVDPREAERRLELLRHEVEEIARARVREGEIAELKARLEASRHGEQISRGAAAIRRALDAEGTGARESLAGAVRDARGLARLDPRFDGIATRLVGLAAELEDVGHEVRSLADAIDHDDAAILGIEERLSILYGLLRRYGDDEAAVLAHAERAAGEAERLEGLDDERRRRQAEDARLLETVAAAAARLSLQRRAAADRLAVAVDEVLRGLGFRAGTFSVDVGRRIAGSDEAAIELDGDAVAFDATGADEVVFRFAPNPGEPARSFAKIASGGELSRVALAVKQVLAAADATPTLVFDEVDAGIGGRTADPVGRSLWALARDHQVLVVTHLPQIAAHADAHFRIAKQERDGRTVTTIERLDREGRIVELAAMLGGVPSAAGPAAAGSSAGAAPVAGTEPPLRTASGLTAVGPGPIDEAGDGPARDAADLLAPAEPLPTGSAALAQARELLDAAEGWRGRPVLAGSTPG